MVQVLQLQVGLLLQVAPSLRLGSGLRLGLLATRYVTHLLGGEITFESEVGKGASFEVALPNLSASH